MKHDSDIALTIPAALLAKIQAAAGDERRKTEDVVQEILERYLAQRRRNASLAGETQPISTARTPAQAAARLRELRQGNALPHGTTIRDLMTHGRA
jgi:hypothetical protein